MDIQASRVTEFHISPSALSRLVQRLEASAGCPLLIRNNRSAELTDQGQQLNQKVQTKKKPKRET
ncbi:MAG: DNA-binding transcriptional LysR family regulator, partial [Candidatus Azotimanducaceae bacterium]